MARHRIGLPALAVLAGMGLASLSFAAILPETALGADSAGQTPALAGARTPAAAAVYAQDVCPPAPAGHAQCAAEVLALRSSGALVHPRLAHSDGRHALALARRAGMLVSSASAAAQTPPAPGTPAYLQQAYDLSYLSATGGASDTVALVDAYDDPTAESDLASFRSIYGLAPCTTANGCFKKVNEQGQASPLPATDAGWNVEESTDIDAVSVLCPNCHILVVEANSTSWPDMVSAAQTAAALGANQISNSWTTGSSAPPPDQFSFPGVSVVAAGGDSGYLGTSQDNYPAAFANVVAAGGTSLQPSTGTGNPRGFTETAWSNAGSGCDLAIAKPPYQASIACPGRAYADVSADADPSTGIAVYDSGAGGWLMAGGTSVAAPLIAAFEAITGVGGSSPAWAYQDAAELNDPQSGSNGTCATAISEICLAGVGYDGPTGTGSISGAVAAGAPGIGASDVGQSATAAGSGNTYVGALSATSATMLGGVYPNGNPTSYSWQYGTTNAYGQSTSWQSIGAGTQPVPVTGTLSGLVPMTTYHYRLIARNSFGTIYGYDYTLTTPLAAPPSAAVTRTAAGGAKLAAAARQHAATKRHERARPAAKAHKQRSTPTRRTVKRSRPTQSHSTREARAG